MAIEPEYCSDTDMESYCSDNEQEAGVPLEDNEEFD